MQTPELTLVITDNKDNYSCPADAAEHYEENTNYYQVMQANDKFYVEDVTNLVRHFAEK